MTDLHTELDETHDPSRRSWVETANAPDAAFPIQNLPLGMFSPPGGSPRAGVAIGDSILDLSRCLALGLVGELDQGRVDSHSLNGLFAQGNKLLRQLRRRLGMLLDADGAEADALRRHEAGVLHAAASCTMHLPARIGDFTDFFAGIHHARTAGTFMTPDNPLPRNYKWVPIAYHSRASSIRTSGWPIVRPNGQWTETPASDPVVGPSRRLDIELEVGMFVGPGNPLGETIPVDTASDHIAGFCLLNDWSARDLQFWEMVPLGPFLGKNFGTTISPWVVTTEALRPFRIPAMPRPPGDPRPLDYLWDDTDQAKGGLTIDLEVRFSSEAMRRDGLAPEVVITSNAEHLYWTPAQMVAHHAIGGCDLQPGDLIGTGTISGPRPDQLSSFLELTAGGTRPFTLGNGETRTWLEDGDMVELHGTCRRDGFVPIGFGPCAGTILPAKP